MIARDIFADFPAFADSCHVWKVPIRDSVFLKLCAVIGDIDSTEHLVIEASRSSSCFTLCRSNSVSWVGISVAGVEGPVERGTMEIVRLLKAEANDPKLEY